MRTLQIGILAALTAIAASAGVIYSTDFDGTVVTAPGVGVVWSHAGTTNVIPNGGDPGYTTPTNYLGGFNNDTVTVAFSNLPSNAPVSFSFRLLIIDSWDGVTGGAIGPDIFTVAIQGGPTLLSAAFANDTTTQQDYPAPNSPARAGSTGVWGRTDGPWGFGAATYYDLSFMATPTANAIQFNFTGSGLQIPVDESWGLDNVLLTDVPEPGALSLIAVAAFALVLRRRLRVA